MDPERLLTVVNGVLLLALTVRSFWGWIFKREENDTSHGRQIRQLFRRVGAHDERLDREEQQRRERDHALANEITKLQIKVARLETRSGIREES